MGRPFGNTGTDWQEAYNAGSSFAIFPLGKTGGSCCTYRFHIGCYAAGESANGEGGFSQVGRVLRSLWRLSRDYPC